MKIFCQIVMQISYYLGLLALIFGLLLRYASRFMPNVSHTPSGAFGFAMLLFLCALASYGMIRAKSS